MSRCYVLEVVLLLIAAITKVEMKCSNNLLMCLEMSCEELTDEHIEKNIEKINNLDYNGKAALHYAVSSGKLRCVNKLLEYGADPNIKTSDGQTPLHMVFGEYWSCEGCVLSLLERGANQSLTNRNGETPIFNFHLYKCPRCMHTLIKWGGDVDATNTYGDTPLCRLVEEVDEESVRDVFMPYLNTLMKLCADPSIMCMGGMTAKEKAEEYEQQNNIKVLEEYTKKSQCRRNETKAGKGCVCKNGHLQWDLSKDNRNDRKENKNKNLKKDNQEAEKAYNDPLHQDKVNSNGVGCMVNGRYLLEGTNWLEDCWLYRCKEGRIIHTLNPSCKYYQIQHPQLMNHIPPQLYYGSWVTQPPQQWMQHILAKLQTGSWVIQPPHHLVKNIPTKIDSRSLIVQPLQQLMKHSLPHLHSGSCIVKSPEPLIKQSQPQVQSGSWVVPPPLPWIQSTPMMVQTRQKLMQQVSQWPKSTQVVVQSPQWLMQQGSTISRSTPLVVQSPQKLIQQGYY